MKIPFITALFALIVLASVATAPAMPAAELRKKSEAALEQLFETKPGTKELADMAEAVLVFPEVVKAGFMIGGQRGDGVLFRNGEAEGYFNTTSASYGWQVGAQVFSYVLFFMDQKSLDSLYKADGFEVGAAPSLVIANEGFTSDLSTKTMKNGIYAFFFGQKGIMAGISLQGTKITEFKPSK
ncbi:MAG: lipid-binding SYLF domain-containing protein [Chthoniobacterales bacterium]|nr:lipid-binding SYLF domain-containing protein [Chthoniobacterales bacterium]